MLRPRVPSLEAEVARLQVEVQDRNKGLREAQHEESLARAQVRLGNLHAKVKHAKLLQFCSTMCLQQCPESCSDAA